MTVLRFIEGLRNPFLDSFFSLITRFGEETVFILVGLICFWCIGKKQGYYILSIGFAGTVLNQFLKLLFRVPRPWVRDPDFTIVDSARAEASGYSFPSGHTQNAVGIFGGAIRITSRAWLRYCFLALCILVPLSRMYLGVHTPQDVLVSAAIAVVLVFVLYPAVEKAMESRLGMRCFFATMAAFGVAFLLYATLYPFPADIDAHNLASGIENAYKILGCVLGLWLAYEIDDHYTKFETDAVWWAQILKLGLGLIPILLIKSLLKEPLLALFQGHDIANAVRYFLLTAFAGGIWPMTFKWFQALNKKHR